jgi:hypothetical protein
MGRNIGRAGAALAGIIAVIFGAWGLTDKVPSWLLITLGTLAVVGVLADYFWGSRGNRATSAIRQRQSAGDRSINNQAGHDINISNGPTASGS